MYTLEVSPSGLGFPEIIWTGFPDCNGSFECLASFINQGIQALEATIVYSENCTESATIDIEIFPAPEVEITVATGPFCTIPQGINAALNPEDPQPNSCMVIRWKSTDRG